MPYISVNMLVERDPVQAVEYLPCAILCNHI